MNGQYKVINILILLLLMSITSGYAQVEEIPGAALEEIQEAPPTEPAKSPVRAEKVLEKEVDRSVQLYQGLKENGHVVLNDIYFSKGKADLELKSDTCLAAIAKMMTDHPTMKIFIVGHTDNKGHMINLMRFSQQRASAVTNSLIDRFDIDVARLFASGIGPMCPITTNETEQGRAKNNRIELVLQ
jgi:OOP family OmpA-OmpF porin